MQHNIGIIIVTTIESIIPPRSYILLVAIFPFLPCCCSFAIPLLFLCPSFSYNYFSINANNAIIWRSFSSRLLKKKLYHLIWNEAPKPRYHIVPITVLTMHAIRVKSNLNYEESASCLAPPEGLLLDFLCRHFVA